jgi:hypothetical protein
MDITDIDCAQFNQLLPGHRTLERLAGKEIAWFANGANTCVGTIALSVENSWTYVVLRVNRLGDFGVSAVGQNILNYHQTQVQLLSAMC